MSKKERNPHIVDVPTAKKIVGAIHTALNAIEDVPVRMGASFTVGTALKNLAGCRDELMQLIQQHEARSGNEEGENAGKKEETKPGS